MYTTLYVFSLLHILQHSRNDLVSCTDTAYGAEEQPRRLLVKHNVFVCLVVTCLFMF